MTPLLGVQQRGHEGLGLVPEVATPAPQALHWGTGERVSQVLGTEVAAASHKGGAPSPGRVFTSVFYIILRALLYICHTTAMLTPHGYTVCQTSQPFHRSLSED